VVGEKENKGLAGLGFLKGWGILALAARRHAVSQRDDGGFCDS
jgi:hypothetical protein